MKPKQKPVRAYLEKDSKGNLLAWWSDPRVKCQSARYPVKDWVFTNIVEKFRYEGMAVVVTWLGVERILEPTDTPHYVYS